MFSVQGHMKTKSRKLNFPCFQTALFLWRVSVDDRPTRKNKAAFSKIRPISKVNALFFSSDPLAEYLETNNSQNPD